MKLIKWTYSRRVGMVWRVSRMVSASVQNQCADWLHPNCFRCCHLHLHTRRHCPRSRPRNYCPWIQVLDWIILFAETANRIRNTLFKVALAFEGHLRFNFSLLKQFVHSWRDSCSSLSVSQYNCLPNKRAQRFGLITCKAKIENQILFRVCHRS